MTLLLDPPVWIQLPMVVLAAWRVAVLLIWEGGPGGIFRWVRTRMGIQHDEGGAPTTWPDGFPASLFTCVWCLSFWTTLLLYGILWAAPYVVVVLGTWGAATYLEAYRNGR